jgi:hypothetical protein
MKLNDKVKTIIFVVDGGIGKNIASTAVVKSIKEAYPDKRIIVVGSTNEVFLYNPNVYRVFKFDNPLYFYEDFINEESTVFKVEPYLDYGYVTKQSHLIESWCKQLDIPMVTDKPDLYFIESELEAARLYIDKLTETKCGTSKKFILFQWVGGIVPPDKTKNEFNISKARMFRRTLPIDVVQEVVDKLVKEDYIVGAVGHDNFPEIKDTVKIFFPLRSVLALLKYSDSFIGIDSFLQHGAAASSLNTKGVVCWGGTSPTCLGYNTNINLTKTACIQPFCHRPNSYLFDVQPNGAVWDCSYGEPCLKYSADEILSALSEVVKPSFNKGE